MGNLKAISTTLKNDNKTLKILSINKSPIVKPEVTNNDLVA